jgi:tetratricopeptide (TPR) repeat protein
MKGKRGFTALAAGCWKRHRLLVSVAVIALAGIASYSNVYGNQFLWDDEFLIQENAFIRDPAYLPVIFSTSSGGGVGRLDNFYRPVQMVAYTAVYSVAGPEPWAFHLLNVMLHVGNGVLIFFIVRKLFRREGVALVASLLWVVHPVHTEAVTYMSGTADPLSVLFALGSLLAYILFREGRGLRFLGFSVVLFVMALLSKETVIILPLLLMLYEFMSCGWRWNSREAWKRYRWALAFLAVAVVYFSLRLTVLDFGGTLNFYEEPNIYTDNIHVRALTFLASLPVYYSLLLMPVNLHMERDFPVFTSPLDSYVLLSAFILALLALAAWRERRDRPFLGFGIAWFLVSFLPMSGIVPVNSFLLEHWLYLPSVGLFIAGAGLVQEAWNRREGARPFIAVGVALAVAASAGLTLDRNSDWRDPVTFYNDLLGYGEGTARVHNNLAMAYADMGEIALAEQHYLRAIELSDSYPQTRYNLARLCLARGDVDSAISNLSRSLEINPNFFFSYYLLGDIYAGMGEDGLAREYYRRALEIEHY